MMSEKLQDAGRQYSGCVFELSGIYERAMVRGLPAFAAVLTLLSLSISCTSKTATDSLPLVGAWRSTIEFETGAFAEIKDLQFMYVFNAGGTLTESSNYDGAPPVPPAYRTFTSTIRYEALGTRGEPLEGGGEARGKGARIGF